MITTRTGGSSITEVVRALTDSFGASGRLRPVIVALAATLCFLVGMLVGARATGGDLTAVLRGNPSTASHPPARAGAPARASAAVGGAVVAPVRVEQQDHRQQRHHERHRRHNGHGRGRYGQAGDEQGNQGD